MDWRAWFIAPSCDVHPGLYIAAAVTALALVAVSKGGFGGGVGMLSVPLMLQVVADKGEIIAMWLPVLIVCDVFTLPHYPRTWKPRALLKIAPGTVVGIALGTLLLDRFASSGWLLNLGIGAICLVFVGLWAVRGWFTRTIENRPPWEPSWAVGSLAGVSAGVSTMLAHAAGSIVQMYVLPQKLGKREFVGTCARFFFFFNIFKLPIFIFLTDKARLTGAAFRSSLWLFALAPLGVWFGSWLNRKTDPKWFVRLIYVFLGMAGVKLIVDAARTLF
jgi:uncharacterized membrane protein YfcA